MAKIPTYDDAVSPHTGSIAPRLDASAFGGDIGVALQRTGAHIASAAGSIEEMASTQKRAAKQLKTIEDQRWATNAYLEQKDAFDKYSSQPDISGATDIAPRLRSFADQQVASVTADKAPSPEAYQLFKQHYQNFVGNEVGQAYGKGVNNSLNNTLQDYNKQINTAVTTYRESSDPKKLNSFVDSVAMMKSAIDTSFGEHSPKIADGLRADLITQATLAVMADNPLAARSFLKSESSIDEQLRLRLNGEIDQTLRSKDTAAKADGITIMRNELDSAQAGNLTQTKLTVDFFKTIYAEGAAEAKYAEHVEQIRVYADSTMIVQEVGGQAYQHIAKAYAEVTDRTKIVGDQASYRKQLGEITGRHLERIMKLQSEDVAAWQEGYQPAVKQARVAYETSSKENRSAALTRLNATKLLYQGTAPRDQGGKLLVSEAESKMFLSLPMNSQTLLSQSTAESIGGTLNAAKPKEFVEAMGSLLATYQDDKQQMLVFNDLVTKGKLSQQYQFAWDNKGEWWIDTYIGAIHAGSDIKLTGEQIKEIEDNVTTSPAWMNLQTTLTGDNMQRSGEIRGFREGAIQFAKALVASGKSTKVASRLSTDLLIGSNLGFTKVNGHPLVISRAKGTANRTDADITDIGRRLSLVSQFVPMAEVDQKFFTALQAMGTEKAKLSALSDHLSARSFWQVLDDNRAVLYATDENNVQPFQVQDKHGKPFIVDYRELPAFKVTNRYRIVDSQLKKEDVPSGEAVGFDMPYVKGYPELELGGGWWSTERAKSPSKHNEGKRPLWLKTE